MCMCLHYLIILNYTSEINDSCAVSMTLQLLLFVTYNQIVFNSKSLRHEHIVHGDNGESENSISIQLNKWKSSSLYN